MPKYGKDMPPEVPRQLPTINTKDVMAEVYKFMGTEHTKMAPYQSDGTVERFHLTLMQMLLKAEIERQDGMTDPFFSLAEWLQLQ